MRTPSDREMKNGGWFHWMPGKQAPKVLPKPPARRKEAPTLSADGWRALFARLWQGTGHGALAGYAAELGVSHSALIGLEAALYSPGVWAFPMRDATGDIVGARLRANNGRKWAVDGSHAGLIYSEQWAESPVAMVCEGPTDTAAAMTLGFGAIGRPSCRGQEDIVRDLLAKYRGAVVVMCDRDTPKKRPDGSFWFPGQEGAAHLADTLKRPVRIVSPVGKDIRAWLLAGATRSAVDSLISCAKWRNVR